MSLNIIADENINYRLIQILREKEFNVKSVFEEMRGISDEEVIKLVKYENSILLTEDSDFGEWVFAHKVDKFSTVYLRYKQSELNEIADILINFLNQNESNLKNKFIVITPKKIRTRTL